jgi:AcrR family transcriptional regulator
MSTPRRPDLPVGLRERKKQRTRRDIVRVARALFAEKGFERTTVAEIAAGAEISIPTLFTYFGGKEEVFFSRWLEAQDSALGCAARKRMAPAHAHPRSHGDGDRPRHRRTAGGSHPSAARSDHRRCVHHGLCAARRGGPVRRRVGRRTLHAAPTFPAIAGHGAGYSYGFARPVRTSRGNVIQYRFPGYLRLASVRAPAYTLVSAFVAFYERSPQIPRSTDQSADISRDCLGQYFISQPVPATTAGFAYECRPNTSELLSVSDVERGHVRVAISNTAPKKDQCLPYVTLKRRVFFQRAGVPNV